MKKRKKASKERRNPVVEENEKKKEASTATSDNPERILKEDLDICLYGEIAELAFWGRSFSSAETAGGEWLRGRTKLRFCSCNVQPPPTTCFC